MKRTKEWWAGLSKGERIRLVWLERANNRFGGHSRYYPDDCSMCSSCGAPATSSTLCHLCFSDMMDLIRKANMLCQAKIDERNKNGSNSNRPKLS